MCNKTLAIVIPAYKIDFFEYTLKSLANQTCKDFILYIGDDNSSSDFKSLVSKYESQIEIVYDRFEDNLGGKDLVGQWERCIALTRGEPWICLFSDDDVLGERFVESFLNEVKHSNSKYDIYHFNVRVIDSKGEIIKNTRKYPIVIDSWSFYKEKASAKLDSFVVEYIFSRSIYESVGGFEKFDMAWGSDIATWIKMGAKSGIKTISGEYVYWRQSEKNITPNHSNEMVLKKINTEIQFQKWVSDFFGTTEAYRFNKYAFFRSYFFYSLNMNWQQAKNVVNAAVSSGNIGDALGQVIKLFFPVVRMAKYCKSKVEKS